jgi:hypothetical protein
MRKKTTANKVIDKEKLIPEIKDWKNSGKEVMDIEQWIVVEGNLSLDIGNSFIFWPDFIEYNNCVVLEFHFSENDFKNWTGTSYIENYSQIESVINHIHILYLFALEKKKDIIYGHVKFLGNTPLEIYGAKLKIQYPTKSFLVTFNGDELCEDLLDYQMTFHQRSYENRIIKT